MSSLATDPALALPAAESAAAAPAPAAVRMVAESETKRVDAAATSGSTVSVVPENVERSEVSESATNRGIGAPRAAPGAAPTISPEMKAALERGASQLAGALGTGLRAASQSLEASSPGALEALLEEAPELDLTSADPLATLAARLAAESDFWQRLALRSLQRAVGAERASYALVAGTLTGALGLGCVAAIGALFPGAHPGTRVALLSVGGLALLIAALVGHASLYALRRGQQEQARHAQEHAGLAESRLARLAFAIAQRRVDPDAYRATLAAWVADGGAR